MSTGLRSEDSFLYFHQPFRTCAFVKLWPRIPPTSLSSNKDHPTHLAVGIQAIFYLPLWGNKMVFISATWFNVKHTHDTHRKQQPGCFFSFKSPTFLSLIYRLAFSFCHLFTYLFLFLFFVTQKRMSSITDEVTPSAPDPPALLLQWSDCSANTSSRGAICFAPPVFSLPLWTVKCRMLTSARSERRKRMWKYLMMELCRCTFTRLCFPLEEDGCHVSGVASSADRDALSHLPSLHLVLYI